MSNPEPETNGNQEKETPCFWRYGLKKPRHIHRFQRHRERWEKKSTKIRSFVIKVRGVSLPPKGSGPRGKRRNEAWAQNKECKQARETRRRWVHTPHTQMSKARDQDPRKNSQTKEVLVEMGRGGLNLYENGSASRGLSCRRSKKTRLNNSNVGKKVIRPHRPRTKRGNVSEVDIHLHARTKSNGSTIRRGAFGQRGKVVPFA